jgi:hypothetical protein
MCKVAVMNTRDRKHPKEIQGDSSPHSNRAPSYPDDSKAAEMQSDKRHHSYRIDLVRLTTQPFDTARTVVRIDPPDQGGGRSGDGNPHHQITSGSLHSG